MICNVSKGLLLEVQKFYDCNKSVQWLTSSSDQLIIDDDYHINKVLEFQIKRLEFIRNQEIDKLSQNKNQIIDFNISKKIISLMESKIQLLSEKNKDRKAQLHKLSCKISSFMQKSSQLINQEVTKSYIALNKNQSIQYEKITQVKPNHYHQIMSNCMNIDQMKKQFDEQKQLCININNHINELEDSIKLIIEYQKVQLSQWEQDLKISSSNSQKTLNKIVPTSLLRLRSIDNPPVDVNQVITFVQILLDKEPSWKSFQQWARDSKKFSLELQIYFGNYLSKSKFNVSYFEQQFTKGLKIQNTIDQLKESNQENTELHKNECVQKIFTAVYQHLITLNCQKMIFENQNLLKKQKQINLNDQKIDAYDRQFGNI